MARFQLVDISDSSIVSERDAASMPPNPAGKPTWRWRAWQASQAEIDAAAAKVAADSAKAAADALEAIERAAARARFDAIRLLVNAVKADPTVISMIAITPTAQAATIEAMTTLPQLKSEVKRLAMIVNVLAQQL